MAMAMATSKEGPTGAHTPPPPPLPPHPTSRFWWLVKKKVAWPFGTGFGFDFGSNLAWLPLKIGAQQQQKQQPLSMQLAHRRRQKKNTPWIFNEESVASYQLPVTSYPAIGYQVGAHKRANRQLSPASPSSPSCIFFYWAVRFSIPCIGQALLETAYLKYFLPTLYNKYFS